MAVRYRGCPTGRGRLRTLCSAPPAPGLPLSLTPVPHALANDYISQHFSLPSGLCGEPPRLSPSPSLAGGSARRRRGGARQPRPRGSRGPAAPPCRRGAGGARRRKPGRHTVASGAAGSAMRAAACLLSLALCALPAAPGESRPRGSAAALGAGAAVGTREGCSAEGRCGAPRKRSPRSSLRVGGEGAVG